MPAHRFGPTEIHFALSSNTEFEELVRVMEKVLTLPEIGRFKGCSPCMSGLDRFTFVDERFQRLQASEEA